MLPHEQELFEKTETKYNKFYLPFMWASTIIARCRQEGKIKDEYAMQSLSDEICNFRYNCQALFNYDWICIPIVYTQVTGLGPQVVNIPVVVYIKVFGLNPDNWFKSPRNLFTPQVAGLCLGCCLH